MITGKTQFFGLIGYPLGHSLSPAIHNYLFKKYGQDAVYGCFETADLAGAVKGLPALGIKGYNVTIPFKEKIIPFLDEIDERARLIGAVNTVKVGEKGAKGYNTDAEGFLQGLVHAGVAPRGKTAVVLGAGGAARAVCFSLAMKKVCAIMLYDRVYEKARALAGNIGKEFPGVAVGVCTKETDVDLRRADLLVNATGAGVRKSDPLPVVLEEVKKTMVVYDLIYNPLQTRLMARARARGLTVINGLWMLIYQALAAQKIWTGRDRKESARLLYTRLTKKG